MRRFLVLVTVALLAFGLVAPPAAAKGPPETFDVVFFGGGPNPCTGEFHDITFTLHIRSHFFEDESRHHINEVFHTDLVASDGWTGRGVGTFIDNGRNPAETQGMFTATFNDVWTSPDGRQHFKVSGLFHGTLSANDGGTPRAQVDSFKFSDCHGPA